MNVLSIPLNCDSSPGWHAPPLPMEASPPGGWQPWLDGVAFAWPWALAVAAGLAVAGLLARRRRAGAQGRRITVRGTAPPVPEPPLSPPRPTHGSAVGLTAARLHVRGLRRVAPARCVGGLRRLERELSLLEMHSGGDGAPVAGPLPRLVAAVFALGRGEPEALGHDAGALAEAAERLRLAGGTR